MGVPVDFAEKLKRSYGKNEPQQDKNIAELIDLVFNPVFTSADEILIQYQKRHNKNISKVIMVGGGSLLTGIVDKAQKFFGVETIPGTPFDKIQTPAFLEQILKKTGVMFAGAIGLALRKLQETE
jgi:cell division ATPase FtsA